MTEDNAIVLLAVCLSAVLGYYLGIRTEKLRMQRERRAEATSSLIRIIGTGITQIRGEIAAELGDDFESSEKAFHHLDFLTQLRTLFDIARPTLDEKASKAVEKLSDELRKYSYFRLMLASKSLSHEELNWPKPIEDLMTEAINAQNTLEKYNS
jgi:hypothetical protein